MNTLSASTQTQYVQPLSGLLFTTGLVLLAIHPLVWLVHTWMDPSYQSHGALVMTLVVGLCVWSRSSPLTTTARRIDGAPLGYCV